MHLKNEGAAGVGGSGFLCGRIVAVKLDSRSGWADVGFSSCGVEGNSMISILLSVGVNVALNNSPPGRLSGRREF